jgi:AraC family transcriptional regulator
VDYRIVERPAFDIVGWAHKTTCVGGEHRETIPRFWGQCHAEGKVPALVPHCGPLGLLGVCADWDESGQRFTYLIAVEKRAGAAYPEGTQTLAVPAATYVVVPAVGPMPHAIQKAWKTAYSEWFPSSGYDHAGSPDFEVYPAFPPGDERGDMDGPKCSTEVWIPIRKRG